MPVPQELLDKLNNAQALSEAATQKDQAATTAKTAADQATADALAAHQAGNAAYQDLYTALRAHFGIT